MSSVGVFAVKDETQIRDDGLRALSNYLQLICGIPNPNILPGSDYYGLFTAVAYEIAPLYANCQILGDQLMPDTATGTDLARIGTIYGLSARAAIGSTGLIQYSASQTGLVPTGALLTDSQGLKYQVTTGGTYGNNDLIPIAAIDTGAATNHNVGDSLRWQSPPPYSAPAAVVANGGLTGGAQAENDDNFRARLLSFLQNPVGGGTSTQVAGAAEASYSGVQKAFVYPAYNGPATVACAVIGYNTTLDPNPDQFSQNRDVNGTIVANVITGFVKGSLPEHAYLSLTSVTNLPTDVTFALALPASPAASPPGPGGGWLDGSPWPTVTTAVLGSPAPTSTVFHVNSPTPPSVGSSIAWLSPSTWTLNTAHVAIPATGSPGNWQITIDTPFVGIAAGNYIFPQSANQQAYVKAILAQFGKMGPGEVLLPINPLYTRAFRHPVPSQGFPYSLDAFMLRAIEDAGTEVLNVQYQQINGSPANGLTPAASGVNIVTGNNNPPNIIVPRNIGLYSQ